MHLFQALRSIEAAWEDRPRLGRSRRPRQDPVRLGQDPEMAFPPSTVSRFALGEGPGASARMSTLFFGLFGPHGPLPLHLTEYARDRLRNHSDPTLAAFADVFHHRMLSLLYRAWASGEPAPNHDRGDDPFGAAIAAFTGHRGAAFQNRDALPDTLKRHFAGHLSRGPRSEAGLLAMVSAFFRAPVAVDAFVGTWLYLEREDQSPLGRRRPPVRLGESVVLGARVWSRQARFRIRIGPLDLESYRRLLPGAESLRRLTALVHGALDATQSAEVNPILASAEIPEVRLGRSGQLGWTTWIGRRPPGRDGDELRFTLPTIGDAAT